MPIGIDSPLDANGNVAVNMPLTIAQAGFGVSSAEVDAGTVTGSRLVRSMDITDDFRLRTGSDSLAFDDQFIGVAINTAKWRQGSTTQTITVAGSFLNLNASNLTTASTYALVTSYRAFPFYGTFPTYVEFWGGPFAGTSAFVPNAEALWGAGLVATNAAPTDGAFFRVTPAGLLVAEVYFNSAIQQVQVTDAAASLINTCHHYLISCSQSNVDFWIDGVLVAEIATDATSVGTPFSQVQLPVVTRSLNTASVPAVYQKLQWSKVTVSFGDINNTRLWQDTLCGMGNGFYQGQTGGVMGQTAVWANSAAPTVVTLTNTTSTNTAPQGIFNWNALAGGNTDYILTAYLNPAIAAGAPNNTIYIRRVTLNTSVGVVDIATTPTTLLWGIAVGSTAVSLATVEGAGTKAPRREVIGQQFFPVGAVVGQVANTLEVPFDAPLVVEPGTYIHIILRVLRGTATVTQTFYTSVTLDANWE